MSLRNRNRNFKKIMEEPNAEGRQRFMWLSLMPTSTGSI